MPTIARRPLKQTTAILALALLACATGAQASSAATISGTVMKHTANAAGQSVTLYAAGASRATELGRATTNSAGQFTINYTTPARALDVLYVQSTGNGAAVTGRRAAVSAAAMRRQMAVVGLAAAPADKVLVNERTTVASGFALAQFLHGIKVYGPAPGLQNAAATASNLVEQTTGKPSTILANSPNGTATETLPIFTTLANVVLSCTRGIDVRCRRVLAAAQAPGESRPATMISAIAAIARTPTVNPRRLFGLRAKKKAWTPSLTKPPTAWFMALIYTGSGLNAPGRMAFDAQGRIWAGNNFAIPGSSPGKVVTLLTATGAPIGSGQITGGGINGAGWGTTIDQSGQVWIGNFAGNSISRIQPDGTVDGGAFPYAIADGAKPQGIAIAADGTAWTANFGVDTLLAFDQGDVAKARTVSPTGIDNPFAVAVDDVTGAVWVSNQSGLTTRGSVLKLRADGQSFAGSPFRPRGLLSPQGLALDSAGNVWVASLASGRVVQLKPSGAPAPRSPFSGDSLFGSWGIAIDGEDKVWVAGFIKPNLTVLCGRNTAACPPGKKTGDPLNPSGGFTNKGLQHQTAVQIDQSGNVWTANNWSTGSSERNFVGGNGLVQVIGAAAPVATPMLGRPKAPTG